MFGVVYLGKYLYRLVLLFNPFSLRSNQSINQSIKKTTWLCVNWNELQYLALRQVATGQLPVVRLPLVSLKILWKYSWNSRTCASSGYQAAFSPPHQPGNEENHTPLFTFCDRGALGQCAVTVQVAHDAVCVAGSSIQILYRHLQSLVCTGKGEKKVCNVCFKEKPIDSHIISKRVLDKAYEDRECRSIMLVDSQRPLTISTPSAWVEKLECGQCDRSTSRLEGAFVTRFHTYAPNIELHRQDALLFLLYGYRVLSMRKTFQYSVKDKLASYEELEAFMVQVWNIRRALLHGTEIDFSATNRVLFHVLTKRETKKSSYQIALVPCCVDLTAADPGHPDLKCCPLIYTKVRHCCWAVLLGDHTAADLQRHFWRMIDCIDCQLSQEKIEPQGIVRKNILRIEV